MNIKIIFYFLGWVLNIEALLMLLPCAVSLLYGDGQLWSFLLVMVLCVMIGWLTTHKRPENTVFYAKEGFVIVAFAWLLLSALGAFRFFSAVKFPAISTLFLKRSAVLRQPALRFSAPPSR